MSAQHVVLPGSSRPAASNAKRLRSADPTDEMEVTVTLRGPKLPDADDLPQRSLTPAELETQYGADRTDAETVERVLGEYGLRTEEVALGTRSMRVSGPVRAMETAFSTSLGIYHSADQGSFRGREGVIQVPTELDGIITGVFGLDERRVARRKAVSAAEPVHAATKLAPLTPADLEKRYRFPPGQGAGQKIGIAEFGGGYFPDDLSAFCTRQGRPTPAATAVPVGLTPLTFDQIMHLPKTRRNEELGASFEVMMDVEIIAGLCPAATISVYFAPFSQKGWIDLLNRAIQDRPVALSVSWGLAEDDPNWSQAARQAINERLAAAAALGITVCVASGDDGAGDQIEDGRAHVDFPSSSPFVLSVGGTMLTGTLQHVTEQVWFEAPGQRAGGGGATGGGVSIFFARPAWQNVDVQSLNGHAIVGRVIPDVAALAGQPLYDLTFVSRIAPNGGTSASAPLWAALIARVNANLTAARQQRFLTPLLYQPGAGGKPRGQAGCRDITIGNNASHPQPGVGYRAKTGFDAVTGWGVPDGAALQEALAT